jgi:hypothetical protein
MRARLGAALAPAAVARGGGVAGDGLNRAPGHGFARETHLREAENLANLIACLHRCDRRRPRHDTEGADGRRPVSDGMPYSSIENKRRAGVAFSPRARA